MTHDEEHKLREKEAIDTLLESLQLDTYIESDKPDARLDYEGKRIGVEVTEYHRSKDQVEASIAFWKSIKEYENKLNRSGERGKYITISVRTQTVFNYIRKKEEVILFKEIDDYLKGIPRYYQYITYATVDPLPSLNEKCIVLDNWHSDWQNVDTDLVEGMIKCKNEKLKDYKALEKNHDIKEYWLLIYVKVSEFSLMKHRFVCKTKNDYTRIYLVHFTDGVLRIK